MATRRSKKFNDFGLGTKNDTGGYRALNKDGSFNVKKINDLYRYWSRKFDGNCCGRLL